MIERLESRTLLSMTQNGDTLVIVGTSGNDLAEAQINYNHTGDTYARDNVNNDYTVFRGVVRVNVFSGAGNDTVALYAWDNDNFDPYVTGAYVEAGSGNDVVWFAGQIGYQVLEGFFASEMHLGEGDDTGYIWYSNGSQMFGGAGADTLFINQGNSSPSAMGGTGNDILDARLADYGSVFMNGEQGNDTFYSAQFNHWVQNYDHIGGGEDYGAADYDVLYLYDGFDQDYYWEMEDIFYQ